MAMKYTCILNWINSPMIDWCIKNVGEKKLDWDWEWEEYHYIIYFRTEEDRTLFELTWL